MGAERSGRIRRLAAAFLVGVFAVSFLASGIGAWLHRSTLNRSVWAERVVPLGEDPEVRAALAAWTTAQVGEVVDTAALAREALPERAEILAVPLSTAVSGWVADRVDRFFASEQFERLWAAAAVQAHAEAVRILRDDRPGISADADGITVDLMPVVHAVLVDVLDRAPALVGREVDLPEPPAGTAPEALRAGVGRALGLDLDEDFGTLVIDDGGALGTARQGVELFDRAVIASALVMVLSAAGALAVSARRRRTALQLLGAAALVAVLVRRGVFVLEGQVVDLVRTDANRPAASAVVHAFVDPFTDAAATALWILGAVALVLAVTGPYRWAERLRTTMRGLARPVAGGVDDRRPSGDALAWLATRADGLRIAGYGAGAAALWFLDLRWPTVVLVGFAVGVWQVVLARAVSRLAVTDPGGPDAQGSRPSRRPAATASDRDVTASLR
jgi:hypothetical protein